MRTQMKKLHLLAILPALMISSCSPEESFEETAPLTGTMTKVTATVANEVEIPQLKNELPSFFQKSNDFPLDPAAVVVETECSSTPFDAVINASVGSNLDALGLDWYSLYAEMNFLYTLTDESPQYFGSEGQYTNLLKKITRNLESFWDREGEITVRGQHNSTLNDKEKIIKILYDWYVVAPGEPEFYADFFVDYINKESTFLVETPLISFDGFAIRLGGFRGQGDLIVIGDGLVELASEAGVEDKVVWNGIMAHEWAHQIQFNTRNEWYPGGAADNIPEATRTTELEADFFTGYYLTHKRGGTYNWKRVTDFLELFFNIGDCSFTSNGHHGTPLQRMKAAQLGYELAKAAQKNGHILTADQVHEVFIASLDDIVAAPEPTVQ